MKKEFMTKVKEQYLDIIFESDLSNNSELIKHTNLFGLIISESIKEYFPEKSFKTENFPVTSLSPDTQQYNFNIFLSEKEIIFKIKIKNLLNSNKLSFNVYYEDTIKGTDDIIHLMIDISNSKNNNNKELLNNFMELYHGRLESEFFKNNFKKPESKTEPKPEQSEQRPQQRPDHRNPLIIQPDPYYNNPYTHPRPYTQPNPYNPYPSNHFPGIRRGKYLFYLIDRPYTSI